MVDVFDPDAEQRVGVTGHREDRVDLWDLDGEVGYVVDRGRPREPELDEGFQRSSDESLVDSHREAADDSGIDEAIDAALHRRAGEAHFFGDLGKGLAGVDLELGEDRSICVVDVARGHFDRLPSCMFFALSDAKTITYCE